MSRLLFDTPWWLPTILAGLGFFLFWTGNNRQEKNVRLGGIGMVLGALAVILASYYVDTDVEKAVKASKDMVYAVEQKDWTKLRTILSPATSLSVFNAREVYANANEIVSGAQRAVDRYGVKNVRILSTTPQASPDLISVTMTVMSEQAYTQGRPVPSSWKMEWQRSGKNWTLVKIVCIKIANLGGDAAEQQLPRLR